MDPGTAAGVTIKVGQVARHDQRFSTSPETSGFWCVEGLSDGVQVEARMVISEHRRAACFLHVSTEAQEIALRSPAWAPSESPSKRNRGLQTKGGPFDFAAL